MATSDGGRPPAGAAAPGSPDGEAADGVVLGLGPEVGLVAAALRAAGLKVRALRADAAGPDEALAWAGGDWAGEALAAAPAGGLFAQLSAGGPRPPPRRGLAHAGALQPLPLPSAVALRSLAAVDGGGPLRSLARAKAWNALADIVGGGQEERSYPDWVIRRMGVPLYENVYAPYALSRWGAAAAGLGAAVAERHHGPALGGAPHRLRPPDPAGLARQIGAAGPEVETVRVVGLRVDGGAVRGVQTSDGEVAVAGRLYAVADPATIGGWLGALDPVEAHLPAAQLRAADALRVFTRGGALPAGIEELHCPHGPAWRVTAVDGGLLWELTVPVGGPAPDALAGVLQQARALGLAAEAAGAQVCRLPQHQPVWSPGCHARLRRVALARASLGVLGAGRAGLFAPLDPPEIAAHAAALAGTAAEGAWELGRARSGLGDGSGALSASFRAFVRA